MAQRIIKNYTEQDYIVADLGDIVLPANGAIDIGGNEQRLVEIASSDSLLEALSLGTSNFQLNDGMKDLSFSEGIDLIRKIQRPTEVDTLGRWVVRSDSRKTDWDVVFQGAGDNCLTGVLGGGIPFTFDFGAPVDDLRWDNEHAPVGYKMQTIDWTFCDWVFLKEGTIYFYNMPKGSYVSFAVMSPPGTVYFKKTANSDLTVKHEQLPTNNKWMIWMQWVINYRLEGTCPMGDELNTESASENAAPNFFIWRAQICVPDVDGYEDAHGHWTLEMYRMSTGVRGPFETTPSKIIPWPPA